MKKKVTGLCRLLSIGLLAFFLLPGGITFAAQNISDLEEGAYSIDYVILHAETESVSIANDYFEKPATIFVEEGGTYIQFPLNHSQWTKELQAPLADSFVDVDIISEDEEEDTRLVEFMLDQDLSEPLEFKMHVLIETMDPVYDNRYTVRFDFDTDTIEPLDKVERVTNEEADVSEVAEDEEASDNAGPSEDDSSRSMNWVIIGVIAVVLVGIFIYFILNRLKNKNRDK